MRNVDVICNMGYCLQQVVLDLVNCCSLVDAVRHQANIS